MATHDVDFYVIIDDDDTEYKGFDQSGVYIINAETGFSENDIKRIKWKKTLHKAK